MLCCAVKRRVHVLHYDGKLPLLLLHTCSAAFSRGHMTRELREPLRGRCYGSGLFVTTCQSGSKSTAHRTCCYRASCTRCAMTANAAVTFTRITQCSKMHTGADNCKGGQGPSKGY